MPEHLKLPTTVLFAVTAVLPTVSISAENTPLLLVANRSSHEITFVDVGEGRIVTRLATGAGPHLLSNVSDGMVVATGYGEFPQPHDGPVKKRPPFASELNSRLTVIDVDERSIKLDTTIDGCTKPHASWIIDARIYVTCEDERQLSIVGLATGQIEGRLDTQQSGTHVLSYDERSHTLAASNTGSGSVTLFNLETGEPQIVPLASGSEGALSVAGQLWVGNAGDGSVSIVDADTGNVTETLVDVCGFPIAFSVASGGNVWLACFASSEVVGFDAQTRDIVQRIALEDQPLNLLAHPTAERLYVSYPRRNAIGEIDLLENEERRRITVGIEPDGLRWAASSP